MSRSRLGVTIAAVAVVFSGALVTISAGASGVHRHQKFDFGSAATATVHPGMQTYTGSDQCTANFVFANGSQVFLGQAAHCAGVDGNTAVDGCTAHSMPLGTEVTDVHGNRIGQLAYSSWLMMQSTNDDNADECAYNDFALIRIDSNLISQTNPSMPTFGGPTGVRTTGFTAGSQIFAYGNSSIRLGVLPSPQRGLVLSELGAGWSHQGYTITPGIPGDSGSGILDTIGRASGLLSTIQVIPLPGANNYSDLHHVIDYAGAHGMSVSLVPGDVSFHHDLAATLL